MGNALSQEATIRECRIVPCHVHYAKIVFQLGNRVPEFESLAARLAAEFGKGFSVRTLYQMRKFYALFPSLNALRSQLTWTHYLLLLQVENDKARE